jgi:manganese/zinc/iron transport system substrate-binding protein
MSRRLLAALLAAVALAVALVAAGCAGSDADGGDGRLRVTTTTNFITDTVRQVGGDRVRVTGLMGPGVDPHLYKASASDVRALREADVIFYGGLQLEGKMDDLLDNLGEDRAVKAVTDDIPRDQLLEAGPDVAEQYDPHVWFDVKLWKQAVETIRATLAERDPDNAAVYERNAQRYMDELDKLDAYAREQLGRIPERQRLLVTSHDAFEYFGRAYGIDVEAIQGISTAAEATTADIQRVAATIAKRDVKAVFVESSVPRQTIDAVVAAASERGQRVRVGDELYSDAAGETGTPEGTYAGMFRANVDRIVRGLR